MNDEEFKKKYLKYKKKYLELKKLELTNLHGGLISMPPPVGVTIPRFPIFSKLFGIQQQFTNTYTYPNFWTTITEIATQTDIDRISSQQQVAPAVAPPVAPPVAHAVAHAVAPPVAQPVQPIPQFSSMGSYLGIDIPILPEGYTEEGDASQNIVKYPATPMAVAVAAAAPIFNRYLLAPAPDSQTVPGNINIKIKNSDNTLCYYALINYMFRTAFQTTALSQDEQESLQYTLNSLNKIYIIDIANIAAKEKEHRASGIRTAQEFVDSEFMDSEFMDTDMSPPTPFGPLPDYVGNERAFTINLLDKIIMHNISEQSKQRKNLYLLCARRRDHELGEIENLLIQRLKNMYRSDDMKVRHTINIGDKEIDMSNIVTCSTLVCKTPGCRPYNVACDDDFLFWTLAIIISSFLTRDAEDRDLNNMYEKERIEVKSEPNSIPELWRTRYIENPPSLILVTNDKQKIFDDPRHPPQPTHPQQYDHTYIKNLYSELEKIFNNNKEFYKLLINGVNDEYIRTCINSLGRHLIRECVNSHQHDARLGHFHSNYLNGYAIQKFIPVTQDIQNGTNYNVIRFNGDNIRIQYDTITGVHFVYINNNKINIVNNGYDFGIYVTNSCRAPAYVYVGLDSMWKTQPNGEHVATNCNGGPSINTNFSLIELILRMKALLGTIQCPPFELFYTLIKYIQQIYFPGEYSMTQETINKFFDGKI